MNQVETRDKLVDTLNSVTRYKPSHVRRLNFGQSILTLDVVKQCQGQKDGALLIARNVVEIPCTEKKEFVRKWVETHRVDRDLDSDESFQSSPILGSFIAKCAGTSPIFRNRRKRTREIASLNNSTMHNTGTMHDSSNIRNEMRKSTFNFPAEESKCSKPAKDNRKENIKRNLFNSPLATTCSTVSDANESPVLINNNSYSYKRRRRKLEEKYSHRKALNQIHNKCSRNNIKSSPVVNTSPILNRTAYVQRKKSKKGKENLCETVLSEIKSSYMDTNMNSVIANNKDEDAFKIMSSKKQYMLIKKLENIIKESSTESSNSKDAGISEDVVEPDSPVLVGKVKEVKVVEQIETDSSDEESDCDCNHLPSINNDSETNLSDQIEDVDTQDVISLEKIPKKNLTCNVPSCASKSPSAYSQTSNKDSDKTYFPKAEQFQSTFTSVPASQKISQVSSRLTDPTDNRTSQSDIVASLEASPQRTNTDPSIFFNLLDSGKKRKKPKRGSLSEKLQLAIGRQISFLRMWRHQAKQATKDKTSLPCVSVHIQSCVTRFSRQFFRGIVIDDSFDLLPRNTNRNDSYATKLVTIMTIPDIVGKIEMKSECIVQIFPPWEVLDNIALTLHVTYINVISDKKKFNTDKSNANKDYIWQSTIKQFDCPCIDAGKIILSCSSRFCKPNVIEKLFAE